MSPDAITKVGDPSHIFVNLKQKMYCKNGWFFFVFVSGVLKETVEACKVGTSVRDLCNKADQRLEEETGKAFKKDKKLLKGKL